MLYSPHLKPKNFEFNYGIYRILLYYILYFILVYGNISHFFSHILNTCENK